MIKLYSPAEPRQGFITREACDRLIQHLPNWLKPVVSFAFQTAWRKEEVLGLKGEYVNMSEGIITLPGRVTKNGKAGPIYADSVINDILKNQRRKQFEDGVRRFPYGFHRMRSTGGSRTERKANRHLQRIGDIKKVWVSACKAAGLQGLLFQDLRRSGIRDMVRNGYSEREAMEINGHKPRQVFDHYNIVDLEDQKAAAMRRTGEA